MKRFSINLEWIIPLVALLTSVDQWVSSTGAADPWQILIQGKPFSPMAAARGIAIVLAVVYALSKVRVIRLTQNRLDSTLQRVLYAGITLLLITETLSISPYTVAAMQNQETALVLKGLHPVLFYIWAILVSNASILAVLISGVASLVLGTPGQPEKVAEKPKPRAIKESPQTLPESIKPKLSLPQVRKGATAK